MIDDCNVMGNLNVLYNKTKNHVELKRYQTSSSCRIIIFYLRQRKPQKERQFLILE